MKVSKIDILNSVLDKDDKMLFSSIYDRLEQSIEKNYSIYSDFLDNRQIGIAKQLFSFLKDSLVFDGGIENCERKLVTIGDGYLPINIIEISNLDKEKVSHRDVLGSLMGLGIKRQKIGDIIIEDSVYFAIKEEISKYVLENLSKIRHYNVEPKIVDNINIARVDEFIDINLTVASLRIDAIISGIINLSREKSKSLILAGKVNLNHFEIIDNKKMVLQNDVISIKGFGRFLLSQINGTTKKDRIKILVKKYK